MVVVVVEKVILGKMGEGEGIGNGASACLVLEMGERREKTAEYELSDLQRTKLGILARDGG